MKNKSSIGQNLFSLWMQQSDLLIALGVVLLIGMLIIPIPAVLLDVFMSLNIAFSLGILLIVMYIRKGSEFTVFPSLLLIMTMFRLAINISSTRLILLQGEGFAGNIILAFGDFVVQKNYVVGFIIFLILIAVQFIVIIKGATRVSEVVARFTLDAMPGKQMSIDADLNSGLISEEEANQRRQDLRKEVDFYGSMDGASKFVQGDVRVGLLITFINIIGGLVVGSVMFGMSLSQAFEVFFILTVGDGLSAQIPSLLLSTATGIIVTRAVSERSLGHDIMTQLHGHPKSIFITGTFILLLAILPGFPKIPLIVIGLFLIMMSIQTKKYLEEKEGMKTKQSDNVVNSTQELLNSIQVDPIEVEIGFNLTPFVDVSSGGDLLNRFKLIRKTCALDLGLIIPPIRIRDNMRLAPEHYVFKIRGVKVASAELRAKKLLAIPSVSADGSLSGEDTVEPTFKTKAKWIFPEDRMEAENSGYSVVDCSSVMVTHLTETLKRHSSELLGRQETRQLLDSLKETHPSVVDDAVKNLSMGKIQKVLQNLLKERVSIRNMIGILEILADYGDKTPNIDVLTQHVRNSLKGQISNQYMDVEGNLYIYTLSGELEKILEESVMESEDKLTSNLNVEFFHQLLDEIGKKMEESMSFGYLLILLCSGRIRSMLKNISERVLSNLIVLSYDEIIPSVKIHSLGIISFSDVKKVHGKESLVK